MKKFLCFIIGLLLLITGLLIGLNIKQSEIGRYTMQNLFQNNPQIPKMLLDTKTGEIWILVIEDGIKWKKIRDINNNCADCEAETL